MRAVLGAVLLAVVITGCGHGNDDPAQTAGHQPAGRKLPPANAVFDYQIGGAYPPATAARIIDRDRGDQPVRGRYNVCYVNAFQTQPEENGWWVRHHRNLLLRKNGRYVEDPGWPGERILDSSTAPKRSAIAAIERGWFRGCAGKGFQAIEPDNLDSWSRSKGLLTKADNVALARLLVAAAHSDRLAIAQKNTAELAGQRIGFDFAIAEECAVYAECGAYINAYGGRVYEIEYTDNPISYFRKACAQDGTRISILLRDRDVVARGKPGYHNETC